MSEAEQAPSFHWPSLEEYQSLKDEVIAEEKDTFRKFYEDSDHFSDMNGVQKAIAADLMAHFAFGVNMAYQRFGGKYRSCNIVYGYPDKGQPTIAFDYGENVYVLNTAKFKKIVGLISNKELGKIEAAGIKKTPVSPRDFFELAGVEEAAHFMFFNEKGHPGKEGFATDDPEVDYYTDDMERSALTWKVAYTQRYMPQYYDELRDLLNRTIEARRKHMEV